MSSKRENRYKRESVSRNFDRMRNFDAHAQTSGAKTVETRYNGAIYNEVFGVTNDFFTPVIVKYMEKNLVIANRFCRSLGPSLRCRI